MWTKPWTFKEGFLIGGGSRTERHHQGDAAGHRTETFHHGDLRRWQSQTLCLRDPVCMFVAFFSFILSMWISLERPPLRTMGETRLWYSFFLPLAGITVYSRWRYKWILTFSTILALVFICVNLFKPEIHDKTLMPALQSPWFAPHVIVYMFAYALLGAATVMAVYLLFIKKKPTAGTNRPIADEEFDITDNLVYVGLTFLTVGMLFGALWAKEAWGHYWSWDPKETWAAITWLAFTTHCHTRHTLRLLVKNN